MSWRPWKFRIIRRGPPGYRGPANGDRRHAALRCATADRLPASTTTHSKAPDVGPRRDNDLLIGKVAIAAGRPKLACAPASPLPLPLRLRSRDTSVPHPLGNVGSRLEDPTLLPEVTLTPPLPAFDPMLCEAMMSLPRRQDTVLMRCQQLQDNSSPQVDLLFPGAGSGLSCGDC